MAEQDRPYSAITWETGDVLTAHKLNHIEQGIQAIDEEIHNARGRGSNDNTLGARIDDLIMVSNMQPTSSNNEIWFNNENEQVQIPTFQEHSQLKENISLAYDFNGTYQIGDYAIFENKLYRCNTVILVPEVWTNEHWIAVNIGNEITTLKKSLIKKVDDLKIFEDAAIVLLRDDLNQTAEDLQELSENIEIDPDDLGLEQDKDTGLVYPTYRGVRSENGIPLAASGGGGGGGNSYTITLTNNLPSRNITAALGTTVSIAFNYSSVDASQMDDGAGVCTIAVGGVVLKTINIPQGDNTIDITDILSSGTNNVRVRVENSEGAARILTYTVVIVSLNITTTMNDIDIYNGDAVFNYTIIGTGDKTIHYVLDNIEIGTETVSTSGRSRSYIIQEQNHGAHLFECYATATVNGSDVTSNRIRLSMVWINPNNLEPIIASTFNRTSAIQGDTIIIPYIVYDPTIENATVTLSIIDGNGNTYSTKTITKNRSIGDPWSIQDYPAGNVTFRIACRGVTKNFNVSVSEYVFPIEPIDDSLVLEFHADGRSNAENNPEYWAFNNIEASFTGFGWSNADGWLQDENNAPVLRFLPGDSMVIPFMPFATDARETGYTIEVEMATRDVQDYESLVLTCMNGGRGFKIASQSALLASEQSSVSMLFREDSRVRITFVIEQRNLNRFIYIYINGIMCGITQYAENDNFAQASPVGLTIGANSCGLDLYRIRCYNKNLTRDEQLDNFICDRSTLVDRQNAFTRNDILNDSDEVTITKLPATLPYMIIACPELPQYKGDKKTGVQVTFTDPADSSKSFIANGAEIDVQGTSSSVYPVKNEKIKFKGGFEINGQHATKYALHDGALPVSTFCIKVDYASCEGANNVELVELYELACREQGYLIPPQEEDSRVRQGIAGRPIALFWQNTDTNQITFVGKANFNNDKSTENVFGFDKYPNAESWEYRNNTSNICLFKGADWTSTKVDDEGKTYMAWQDDLEARYPEDNTNITNIKRVYDFVLAHDRSTVNGAAEKQAMLDDFKAHFNEYFVRNNMLFYYIFTEVFLMVDSRAKNMFLTTYDGTHWLPLPYDMDTALGINNEGALAFEYNLEDTDTVDGSIVFNGQPSVLWQNVRDAFKSEIKNMYNALRSGHVFNYETLERMFEEHQDVWPERLWNEDAFTKYLQPYLLNNENYLDMLQGDKSSQRDWWLYNGFRYRDSKYATGAAKANRIILRGYVDGDPDNPEDAASIAAQMAAANITITPYAHVYGSVDFGSYTLSQRLTRNQTYTFNNPMEYMNDTEIYINSADQLSDVGDLSVLRLGKVANFSAATKLRQLIVGNSDNNYRNAYLQNLTVGNNELLTLVNVCNCTALTSAIDLSGCSSLETVLASGSAITGVQLPNGGHVKVLDLPNTITNLTIQNQKNITSFNVAGYSNLETLRLENTLNMPVETIINNATNLHRVRLINMEWTATNESSLTNTINKLDSCIGMDANGNNTTKAVVTGRVNITTISAELLERIQDDYPELIVIINGAAQYVIRFMNYNNTLLYKEIVAEGNDAINPVTAGYISAPTHPDVEGLAYEFIGWDSLPTNVNTNHTVVAVYRVSCRVRYLNYNNSVLYTMYVEQGGSANYVGSTPTRAQDAQYTYTFNGWGGPQTNIQTSTDFIAQYISTIRTYTVYWKNSNGTVLETDNNVPYGSTTTYDGSEPVHPTDSTSYRFDSWSPDASITPIIGTTECIAQFIDLRSKVVQYLERTLTDYESDTASAVGDYAFYGFDSLKSVKTSATTIGEYAFYYCNNLTTVDLTSTNTITIADRAFYEANKLDTIFVRSNTISTLRSKYIFPSEFTIFGKFTIYVKDNLVNNYKSATNWSVFANNIAGINEYPKDFSTINDTWEQIIAAGEDGTYATKYSIGDIKLLVTSDNKKYYMELVAKNTDILNDNSGTAHMTWLTKDVAFSMLMNPGYTSNYNGWIAMKLRSYLYNTLLYQLEDVNSAIKEVKKTWYNKTTNSTLTSNEKIWIPSTYEMFTESSSSSSVVESNGVKYTKFNSNNARKKTFAYHLRSASKSNTTDFYHVTTDGIRGSTNTNMSGTYVVFGFCI